VYTFVGEKGWKKEKKKKINKKQSLLGGS